MSIPILADAPASGRRTLQGGVKQSAKI